MNLFPWKLLRALLLVLVLGTSTRCQPSTKQGALAEQAAVTSPQYTNALIHESSPYLLEHAHNPVQWYPWGDSALAKAKREHKLVLISSGYAACHWCHVMARESFSDTAVARYMNQHFVAIKVDREERPNVDQVYMAASEALTGGGGWPLNAFALPDGRPFYTSSYLPKAQWLDLLHQLVRAYEQQPAQVLAQAEQLTQGLRAANALAIKPPAASYRPADYTGLLGAWQPYLKSALSPTGQAPKFPLPVSWEFLLQYHYLTGSRPALTAVTTALDQMAMGGIYDQIGGGFARYATDARWKVPHFEKMLYDNGQLVSLYAHAYELTHDPLYKSVLEETLAFVGRELTAPNGGFYASLNADSEGEEGKYYVWREAELDNLFSGSQARLLAAYYQVQPQGNWERGANILYRTQTDAAFAQAHHLAPGDLTQLLRTAKATLRQARDKRVRPSTDDKILTSWNALMLKGYLDAYHATGNPDYLATAERNARFLSTHLRQPDGHLLRSYKGGKATIEAFLDDYAQLADAYIALYQTTFEVEWLQQARQLTDYAVAHFYDETRGLFYYTSDASAPLVTRPYELTDNVLPASNSVLALDLFRLGEYYDQLPYTAKARRMLSQVAPDLATGGPYYANWARLLGLLTYGPSEVAVMGPQAVAISQQLQRHYLPASLFLGGREENLPLLEGKQVPAGTLIYVCRNKSCLRPVSDIQQAMRQLTVNGVAPNVAP